MEKQWTTVSETVRKAQQDARESLTPSKEDVRKNRRIAMALASTGVFLILVGAAPFLFGGNDSSEYAAFLGQDPEVAINAVPAEGDSVGVPSDGLSDDLLDFGGQPESFDIVGGSPTPDATGALPVDSGVPVDGGIPVDTGTPVIPSLPIDPPVGISLDPTETPAPVIVETPVAEIPLPTESVIPTPIAEITPIATEEVITETVEFPVNVHVGSSAEPTDFNELAIGGDETHPAPNQPTTGAPLLPLLAFSGVATAVWRKLKNKNKLN